MEFSKIYNRDEFLNFLRRDFLPDDFSQVNEPVVFATKTTYSKQSTKLGVCKSLDLVVYEIKHSGKDDPRVGLSKEAFRMLSEEWQSRALVLFVPENNASNYRFSLIEIKLEGDQTSAKVHRKYSNPRRYSFVLGIEAKVRTPEDYLIHRGKVKNWEDLQKRFSVEALSKDFFKSYKAQYDKFCSHIGGEEKWQRDYVKKMMGRLVFLQFLQKKGWMGVPAQNNDWEGGDLQYTQNLIKRYEANEKLLSEMLEPLFFDTLNTKRVGDIADPKLGENIKIPYLNGGLFEKDKLDDKDIDFPYSYFAELMEFFSQYNFTIDENDPNDAEVGIDPEMLGHIFENLLEDNKDKGAFYTPKEIVQYMCRQSLIEYLQSKLGKHAEIERFINNHDTGNRTDTKNFIATNARKIEESLDCVKICDPAIGSGAFPMGILNEIFHAKMTLDMTLDRAAVKKNIIQNSIYGVDIEQGAVDIARLRFWLSLVVDESEPQPLPNLDYKIMQGNSLLSRYELNMPFDDVFKEYNRGKNDADKMCLDKYRQLVVDYTNTSDHTQKADFRKTIEDIKSAFRTELSRGEKEKFAKLKGQIIDLEAPMLLGERTKKEKEDLKKLKIKFAKQEQEQADIVNNKLYEDAFEWRFEFPQLLDDDGKFVGFDIVIGNPPYVDVKALDNNQVKEYFKRFATTTNRINLYSIFIEQGHRILNTSGVLCYINPNSMLVNSSYTKLRELIVSDINTIIKLPDNIFESATVETIILLLVKHSESNAINGKYYLSSEKADLKNIDFKVFDKHTWETDPDIRFNIFTDDCTVSLLRKIEEDSVPLVEICDFSLGITPYDKAKGHSQELIKSKGFHSTAKLTDEYVPLIKGSNIHKYCVCGFGDEYLKYTKELGAPRQQRFFTDEKIIFRQILSSNPLEMIVAYSDSDHYFTQIGFSVIPKNKQSTSVKYFVGILNSRLMNYFHTAKYLDSEKITFPKILIENCKQFPIKQAEEPTQIIDLVDKILEAKKADPNADTTALEAQIDFLVYKLYNLTYPEILTIDPKTPITQQQYEDEN